MSYGTLLKFGWVSLAAGVLLGLNGAGAASSPPQDPIGPASSFTAKKLGDFAPCQLTGPQQVQSFSAECLTIEVAEQAGTDRRIRLSLVKLPAVGRRAHNDPIILLAGGPGGDAQSMYTQVAHVFARAGRQRDILLLDQRGTGRSTPLRCPTETEELLADPTSSVTAMLAQIGQCRDLLAQRHDLAAYTTSYAVRDLEAVRELLGYTAFNIYAVSYGTRVAQHYARRYPTRVRSLVLDGVVAPATALGPELALHADAALRGLFDRCAADPACLAAFPDLASRTGELLTMLGRKPQPLSIPHPRTGQTITFNFGKPHLQLALRLGSYQAAQAALLPLAIHEATLGNYRPLANLFLLTAESLAESLATGMHNTVVCSEDIPRVNPDQIDRKALQATYLGTDMIDYMLQLCAEWPVGPVDADFYTALESSLPVLLLSGSLDPVTPPADAAQVATTLSNARHLILPNEGHGQLGVLCMDRVLADFFDTPDPSLLDVSCLERKRVPPFWLSLAGPAP
jgi:pimeloyl-ACP methyl ester carboxylesterase